MKLPSIEKCDQYDCDNPVEKIVYWPGRNPAPTYCLTHAIKAIEILNMMGVDVVTDDVKK